MGNKSGVFQGYCDRPKLPNTFGFEFYEKGDLIENPRNKTLAIYFSDFQNGLECEEFARNFPINFEPIIY
jgi:hypothetical protein